MYRSSEATDWPYSVEETHNFENTQKQGSRGEKTDAKTLRRNLSTKNRFTAYSMTNMYLGDTQVRLGAKYSVLKYLIIASYLYIILYYMYVHLLNESTMYSKHTTRG